MTKWNQIPWISCKICWSVVRMCESSHFLKIPGIVETPLQTPSKMIKPLQTPPIIIINSKKFSFHLQTTFWNKKWWCSRLLPTSNGDTQCTNSRQGKATQIKSTKHAWKFESQFHPFILSFCRIASSTNQQAMISYKQLHLATHSCTLKYHPNFVLRYVVGISPRGAFLC